MPAFASLREIKRFVFCRSRAFGSTATNVAISFPESRYAQLCVFFTLCRGRRKECKFFVLCFQSLTIYFCILFHSCRNKSRVLLLIRKVPRGRPPPHKNRKTNSSSVLTLCAVRAVRICVSLVSVLSVSVIIPAALQGRVSI